MEVKALVNTTLELKMQWWIRYRSLKRLGKKICNTNRLGLGVFLWKIKMNLLLLHRLDGTFNISFYGSGEKKNQQVCQNGCQA